MTSPATITTCPWESSLPQPRTGPATKTITLALSEDESACLTALAARWGWQIEHVAVTLLNEGLACRYADDQPMEVAP